MEDEDLREEDAYEYFSSPDMGSSEDYGARRSTRGGREERDGIDGRCSWSRDLRAKGDGAGHAGRCQTST